jgi:hypothetical protein
MTQNVRQWCFRVVPCASALRYQARYIGADAFVNMSAIIQRVNNCTYKQAYLLFTNTRLPSVLGLIQLQ